MDNCLGLILLVSVTLTLMGPSKEQSVGGKPRLGARSAATFSGGSLSTQENDSNAESRREYYQPIYIPSSPPGGRFWVDVDPEEHWVIVATGLPGREVQDKSIRTSFDFPFYGHPVRNVSIAMEGFLSIGSLLMESMASTQYIAPLMANFDATLDPMSAVRYRDNGSSLTVEWYRVRLEDNVDAGSFTFQVTLCSDGRIIFVYKEVPIPTSRIDDSSYPVRVGISDAYTVDILLIPFANVHRKTVYEYHTLDLELQKVKSGSTFLLSPLPTCGQFTDCWSCVAGRIGFQCGWCASVNMCSDGYDRNRQQWVDADCDQQAAARKCEDDILPSKTLATSKPKEPPLPPPEALDISYTSRRDGADPPLQVIKPKSSPVQEIALTDDDSSDKMADAREPSQVVRRFQTAQALETEVIIGILVAVVIVVVAIAWIIHAYSRRSTPELVVVEWRPPEPR